jgi:ribosome-associated translation inhibitor RaiA
MIVQVRTRHLSLPDERFAFVVEQLERPLQALKQVGRRPLQVEVLLEKTVHRAPQTRRGDRLYRADVTVDLPGGALRAAERADDLQRAVVRMAQRLGDVICERREEWAGAGHAEAERAPVSRRASGPAGPIGDGKADENPLSRLTETPSAD